VGLSPGAVFAGYLIERQLGVGGMGAVYAARHPRLPRLVALKVLNEHLCTEPEFRARFEREAELAARVDHPNVVSVYDRGIEGEQLWIAMQYVDGVDVHQLIKGSRSGLTPRKAVFILTEAAKGLDGAHRRGLLHGVVSGLSRSAGGHVDPAPDDGESSIGGTGFRWVAGRRR
jgi:serine/threonine-protein kinase